MKEYESPSADWNNQAHQISFLIPNKVIHVSRALAPRFFESPSSWGFFLLRQRGNEFFNLPQLHGEVLRHPD